MLPFPGVEGLRRVVFSHVSDFCSYFCFLLYGMKENGKPRCENGVVLGKERIKRKEETTVTEVGCPL